MKKTLRREKEKEVQCFLLTARRRGRKETFDEEGNEGNCLERTKNSKCVISRKKRNTKKRS